MSDPATHFILSHDVYEQAAIMAVGETFAAHLALEIVSTCADETEIVLRTLPASSATDSVIGEFLNHVLDLSIRQKLGRG
jgi:hypothetical protein